MAHEGRAGLSLVRLTFLGTSAAQPTIDRNLSGLAVKLDADLLLLDCGEGSQRQMVRFGTGLMLQTVFFTHFHADHYLGIIGLLRTLGMQGRTEPLVLHGPRGARRLLDRAVHLGVERLGFPIELRELADGTEVRRPGYVVRAVEVDHSVPGVGYVIAEDQRPGRFDVAAARARGLPPGPGYGALQRGEAVPLPDGTLLRPDEVLGPPRPGRRVVLSGDTRPSARLAAAAAGADLLIHEATFSDDEQERALATRHSTAREAGRVAREAGARRLLLTHLSSRHDRDPGRLADEARQEFTGPVDVAHDGLTVELPPPA